MRVTRLVRNSAIGVGFLAIAVFLGVTVPLAGFFAFHVLVRLAGGEVDSNSAFISMNVSAAPLRIALGVVASLGLVVGWWLFRRARPQCGAMKIYASRFIAIIAAATAVLRPSLSAQSPDPFAFPPTATASDVSFTLSTDQTTYRVGQPISVAYEIVNVSGQPLYAPRYNGWCPSTHVHAWLEDSAGRHTGGAYIGADAISCQIPNGETLEQRIAKEFVLLKPGERLRDKVVINIKNLSPGAYRVEAELQGWTAADGKPPEAELAKMGAPFLMGEVPASAKVTLIR